MIYNIYIYNLYIYIYVHIIIYICMGDFHKWGYPKMDGLKRKIPNKNG